MDATRPRIFPFISSALTGTPVKTVGVKVARPFQNCAASQGAGALGGSVANEGVHFVDDAPRGVKLSLAP